MRRPHRSLRERLGLRGIAVGRRLPPPIRGGLRRLTSRPITRGLRGLPAETVTSFDAWAVGDDLVRTIGEILAGADIEFVHLTRSGHDWLVVDAADAEAATRALQGDPVCQNWIAEVPGRRTPLPLREVEAAAPRSRLRLYRHLRSPSGAYVSSRELRVALEFWQATDTAAPRADGGLHVPGTRRPSARNRVAPYLAPKEWAQAQARPDHRLPAQDRPNLLEFIEPIDAVYTWVDDHDPAWRERRAAVSADTGGLASDALDAARTRDRDELRYSLRSLAMYAGWIRHIWIVTDGQVPAWLDLDHPRISVVSHAEIFSDPAALPVFNSHAIESQLHHLPGLAEHFLYLNDDFFFGRPVRPELFFHGNGLPKMMVSSLAIDLDTDNEARNGAMLAARRDREWIEKTFAKTITHRMQHVPHAHRRSVLADLEALAPADFDRIAHSRFRHRDDFSIPSELGHYYGFATGRTVSGSMAYQYVDAGSPLAAERLRALLTARAIDCFCVNDVSGSPKAGEEDHLRRFFAERFPLPSPFEVPSPPEPTS